jgi:RimK family alpha-L-glutamate ligase
MRAAILSTGSGWHTDELARAFAARGHTSALFPFTSLVGQVGFAPGVEAVDVAAKGQALGDFDVVVVRIIPRGSLEQIIFRMDALHLLAASGVRVFNPPRAIERTVDKFYTSGLMAQAGLRTPRTVVCEHSAEALVAFAALGGDVVVKPIFGSMGLGMARVQDEEIAYRVFKALELERAVYYVQETVPHEGRDLRAFVLGGRVLRAMERVSDGWRTNIARGARARPVSLTPEQERDCLRATEAVGAECAGVDLQPTADGGHYLLEVNGIPGWQGLQTTTDLNIADEIVAYLEAGVGAPTR